MWRNGWRASIPQIIGREWDLVIIGGGITGAGILLEAARRGVKAVLVEQRDFAWGTSSRSSKLVHGGLRYLKEGKFGLTRESVHERQKLLQQAAGLVEPQSFAFADYQGRKPGRWMFSIGLAVYDLMAGQRGRHYYPPDEFLMLAPHIERDGLNGGLCYNDAKTDDARLVLRVLQEAIAAGGVALNYMAAKNIVRVDGKATGVALQDGLNGAAYTVNAKVVISATGAWADSLRPGADNSDNNNKNSKKHNKKQKIRPLRGSHLIFPAWRLPVAQAISLMHPLDGRPVFAYPWEGVTLVGTTDVDHHADMREEAAITPQEVVYLMAALNFQFPALRLNLDDIIATYAGVRPVIDTGKSDPSKEGRDHAVWLEDGLLTVTGGKLTTFRPIALDVLRNAAAFLPKWDESSAALPIFTAQAALPPTPLLHQGQRLRLEGRYGVHAIALLAAAQPGELATIAGSDTLWAELRWAARAEAVLHLEDLMLRRTRLGLQMRGGGIDILPRIRTICQPELGWDDAHWDGEQQAYLALWERHYSLPPHDQMPGWSK
jgi:glycerol-3-phosphate dehydrogenase